MTIAPSPEVQVDGPGRAYPWYALGVLILAYIFAFLDRQILNLLVEPIKRDLHLNDTQVSLLQGLAFALFLSIGGLPLGRLIDTRRRVTVLAVGIAVWSVMTAGCGLARTYVQLLLCRVGVGVGEAAMTPSAYSLIGDLFKPRQLGLAVGLYSMGAYFGSGLALIAGASVIAAIPVGEIILPLLGPVQGWQTIFLVVGLPGLLVALLVATLREPRRGGPGASPPSWAETLAYFRANATALIPVNLCVAFSAMAMYGLAAWIPSFFIRAFGWTASEVGHGFGLIVMTCGAAGTLSAGLLGDRLKARGLKRGRMWVMLGAATAAIPFAIAAPLSPSPALALTLIAPLIFCLTLAIGSGPATLQEVTPNRMRGMQHALAVLTVNLVGLGLGPTLIALITDYGLQDERKVGLALAIGAPLMLAVSVLIGLVALKPYAASQARIGDLSH